MSKKEARCALGTTGSPGTTNDDDGRKRLFGGSLGFLSRLFSSDGGRTGFCGGSGLGFIFRGSISGSLSDGGNLSSLIGCSARVGSGLLELRLGRLSCRLVRQHYRAWLSSRSFGNRSLADNKGIAEIDVGGLAILGGTGIDFNGLATVLVIIGFHG